MNSDAHRTAPLNAAEPTLLLLRGSGGRRARWTRRTRKFAPRFGKVLGTVAKIVADQFGSEAFTRPGAVGPPLSLAKYESGLIPLICLNIPFALAMTYGFFS